MVPHRGHNLPGRFARLAKVYRKPEPPEMLELVWGDIDDPSFGVTIMPDGDSLPYPISFPHLDPARRAERQQAGDDPEPDPTEAPSPAPAPPRRAAPQGDPVLYHHLSKFEALRPTPPPWETYELYPPDRPRPHVFSP